MAQSFSLAPHRCAVLSDPTLRAEIHAHTENADDTSRILRSLSRFGTDPSILFFEMTPQTHHRGFRAISGIAWQVRAVRPQREIPAPELT